MGISTNMISTMRPRVQKKFKSKVIVVALSQPQPLCGRSDEHQLAGWAGRVERQVGETVHINISAAPDPIYPDPIYALMRGEACDGHSCYNADANGAPCSAL